MLFSDANRPTSLTKAVDLSGGARSGAATGENADMLLDIRGLKTQFALREGVVKAVDGLDLRLRRRKTLCVVGESGCGKSITAWSILQLLRPPGRIVSGEILFHHPDGKVVDLAAVPANSAEMRGVRGRHISMIFQEPMTSLSPVHTIGDQLTETIRLHLPVTKEQAKQQAIALLGRVGIPKPEMRFSSYPFQLSGGMRQRVMIAIALSCRPDLLIADEPTTALDVTTQANILELIKELQEEFGIAVMLITHDLGVVAEVADEVAVMYLGRVVERADVYTLFEAPKHPYTRALLRSVPQLGRTRGQRLASIEGMVPNPFERPSGCPFHTRCPDVIHGICDRIEPPLVNLPDGSEARCLQYDPEYALMWAAPDLAKTVPTKPTTPAVVVPPPVARQIQEEVCLEVSNLKVHFPITKGMMRRTIGTVKAVDGASFTVRQGETVGLVGESGCGKSTLGRSILRVYKPTDGSIHYRRDKGEPLVDLASLNARALKPYRTDIRLIFQDPFTSLNPRKRVVDIIGEPLRANGMAHGRELNDRVAELMEKVGLRPEYMTRYPHAFSGGERQRIVIARALVVGPHLVVADEAVSALDVSVRAQTLNLLQDLQNEFDLTYLFISHDLSVVEHISDHVAVMYVGRLVEFAPSEALFANPRHPYTEALLSAVPQPDPRLRGRARRIKLHGEVADPANAPSGCPFHPRCAYATDLCTNVVPPLRELGGGRRAACHYAEELNLRGVA